MNAHDSKSCYAGMYTRVQIPFSAPIKEVTFVYQKLLLFLSIAKAMVCHHALACISSAVGCICFRNDDIQHFVLMICRADALIYLRKCGIICLTDKEKEREKPLWIGLESKKKCMNWK